eukprot:1356451-Amphidinium_carterae.1
MLRTYCHMRFETEHLQEDLVEDMEVVVAVDPMMILMEVLEVETPTSTTEVPLDQDLTSLTEEAMVEV